MQTKKFYHLGRLMSMSLVQGGSGFPFFAPPMFKYLCGVEMSSIEVSQQDVPNLEVLSLLKKVYGIAELRLHKFISRVCRVCHLAD